LDVYCTNGERHRDDGPAYIQRAADFTLEIYYRHGREHRDGGEPALVAHDRSGTVAHIYYQDGKPARANGLPAYVETHTNGASVERWFNADGFVREERKNPSLKSRLTGFIPPNWKPAHPAP
jgi:hypothetical protein